MKVIIADDHAPVAWALSHVIQKQFGEECRYEVVDNSDSLLEVLNVDDSACDVLVLDMVMPGRLRRLGLIEAVKQAQPTSRVLVYSASESPHLASAAMKCGVDGYIQKGRSLAMLARALAEVAAGGRFVDAAFDLVEADKHPWFTLTDEERKVLLALAKGRSLKELALATGRTYSTVTAHKYAAYRKLGVPSSQDIQAYLYAEGLEYEMDLRHD